MTANSALLQAVSYRELTEIVRLIREGADPNALGPHGWAPLHQAVMDRQPNVVACLLQNGANIEVRDQYGSTSLMHALDHSSIKMLEDLLAA